MLCSIPISKYALSEAPSENLKILLDGNFKQNILTEHTGKWGLALRLNALLFFLSRNMQICFACCQEENRSLVTHLSRKFLSTHFLVTQTIWTALISNVKYVLDSSQITIPWIHAYFSFCVHPLASLLAPCLLCTSTGTEHHWPLAVSAWYGTGLGTQGGNYCWRIKRYVFFFLLFFSTLKNRINKGLILSSAMICI